MVTSCRFDSLRRPDAECRSSPEVGEGQETEPPWGGETGTEHPQKGSRSVTDAEESGALSALG